jgi:shikimate kinase
MERRGRAKAPAAGTIINALATGTGGAFAIDRYTTATVTLSNNSDVRGTIEGMPDIETTLIERAVARTTERFGDGEGGTISTESEVPIAAGLKSSSAAANAAVIATLDALGREDVSPEAAIECSIAAARDAGVTTTGCAAGAFASMLGGVAIADNTADELLAHSIGGQEAAAHDWAVLAWLPGDRAFSADADVDRCKRVAPMADLAADLALNGAYGQAMTVNGFVFCAALSFPTEPLVEALPHAAGVTLSGTGSSYTAIGNRADLESVKAVWADREGTTWLTAIQTSGTRRN